MEENKIPEENLQENLEEQNSGETNTPINLTPFNLSEEGEEQLRQLFIMGATKNKVKRQLTRLKNRLAATDYKVLKCYEYSLMELEQPYDISLLHSEREDLRNQIRELEETL
jgi:hypothetical protein